MAHLNYNYKLKKKEDRKDLQAFFMINQEPGEKYKKQCENKNIKPSYALRSFIEKELNIKDIDNK